jgi:predicted deacylase
VRYALQGVRAACIRHGQMRGQIEPIAHHAAGTQVKAAIVDAECYTPAPFPGHYEEGLPCGMHVEKGAVVGWLHDFNRIDDAPYPVRAGVEGIVVGQAWSAVVQQGQHILAVGRIVG